MLRFFFQLLFTKESINFQYSLEVISNNNLKYCEKWEAKIYITEKGNEKSFGHNLSNNHVDRFS